MAALRCTLKTMPMPRAPARLCFALLALVAGAAAAGAASRDASSKQHVYKWTDEQGVVHYGDAVPPQYADQEKTVLNSQGMPVGTIAGKRTPAQLATDASVKAADERASATALQNRQRDQNLLATYLTVAEIEQLRDRRAEIVDAQARVTSLYLEQLRGKQRQLEQQTQHFRPYSSASNAVQLPERLAEDLVRTTTDIATQERNLEAKRQELETLKAKFADDIVRFRELKNIAPEDARGARPARN
jgi:hypothetical protein